LSLFKNANARSVENTVSTSVIALHKCQGKNGLDDEGPSKPQHIIDLSVFKAANAYLVENTVSTLVRSLHEPPYFE
jgi:hypothetical protein